MVIFCRRCHQRIEPPDFLNKGNIKVGGKVVLTCGNCKKGRVTLGPDDLPAVPAPDPED